MKQEIKQKWVARLRELPNDMQTKGTLKRHDGKMCCLGVLCEIAVEENAIASPTFNDERDVYVYSPTLSSEASFLEGFSGVLPPDVSNWAGLKGNPVVGDHTAAILNDSHGKNFDEIADLIEKHL